jgi:EpsI family protein
MSQSLAEPRLRVWPAPALAAVTALTALLIVAHLGAFRSLLGVWDRNPMYSHGYLVLPIALYLVWAMRERLARIPIAPAVGSGTAVLVGWLALMVLGRLGGVLLFEQAGLLVAIIGVVLALFGWRMLAAVAGPIAYLLLMLPFWDVITDPLQVRFQNASAAMALPLLRAVGIPASRDGIFLTLPTIQLEVARACSGVNYLVAVLALGLPLAALYLRTTWRRIVLIVSSLVVAALSNVLRVTLIGILVTRDPDTPLHGPGHILHGLFVAGAGYVTLFAVLGWLTRGERAAATGARAITDGTTEHAAAAAAPMPRMAATASGSRRLLPAALIAAALFGGATLLLRDRATSPVALAADLETVPRQLGGWVADPIVEPAAPVWWPAADRTLRRRYRHGALEADVYVGYFAQQHQSREVLSPSADALHRLAVPGPLPASRDGGLQVNRASITDGPARHLTVFWYDVDGRAETSPTGVKLRTLWNAILRDHTNGAVISVTLPLADGADAAAAAAALDDLALALDGTLARCLPGRAAGGRG